MAIYNWIADVINQVAAVSIQPPRTRDDVVAYYKEQYPGTKVNKSKPIANWQEALVTDLQPITGYSRDNLMRRFQNRKNKDGSVKNWWQSKPSKKQEAEYKKIGDAIGVKPPIYGYRIVFDGWILFSCCEKRHIEVTVTGAYASEVAKNHVLILDAMLLIWMEEDDADKTIAEQESSVGICMKGDSTCDPETKAQDPVITITANTQATEQDHVGRRRHFSLFGR